MEVIAECAHCGVVDRFESSASLALFGQRHVHVPPGEQARITGPGVAEK